MEYTDNELLNWWASLNRSDKEYLLETMVKKMEDKDFPQRLKNMFELGFAFSPKQIAVIRKWDHS